MQTIYKNRFIMKVKILLSALAIMFAMNVSAQETKDYPHAFIGVQGGAMRAFNGEGIDRKWNPMAAISVGYNFTDVFGLRLQANGSSWKAKLDDGSEYKSKAANIDLDMMFNLSNLFFPNQKNFVNVIAIAGAPFNLAIPHAWVDNYAYATNEGSDRWNTAWKAGGMIDFAIAKNWGINLEAGTNYIRQKNNGNDNNKWWPYAMAGITFKFGHKKAKNVAPEAVPYAEEAVEANQTEVAPAKPVVEPKPTPRPEPKPEPKPEVKKPMKITENIFFDLAKSEIKPDQASKIEDIVRWANQNPDAKILLTGYADKDTGNAKVNMKIAQQRAEAVKAAMVAKGIAASRLTIDAKGDTEQPFANNDDNRAVIALGESK
jgi:OOP family OmpA-OmpF porin